MTTCKVGYNEKGTQEGMQISSTSVAYVATAHRSSNA